MDNWISIFISGVLGALIGTFGGSFFLFKLNELKNIKLRRVAINALKIFQKYYGKTFTEAENEFNTLTVSEKRICLVALHKLGLPIGLPPHECFDIKRVRLLSRLIEKDAINGMIKQIDTGNCDNLFYLDVESYFSSNIIILTMRSSAQRYVLEVLSKSKVDLHNRIITYPNNWITQFTFGEYKTIQAFQEQVNDTYFFNEKGEPDENKISSLLIDIDLGLWDQYLTWSFESYQNIKLQNAMTQTITNQLSTASKPNTIY